MTTTPETDTGAVRHLTALPSRQEFRCPSCGYGAVAVRPPAPCPMCGEDGPDARRLLTGEVREHEQLTIRRLGPTTILITPHGPLDRETAALVGEAIAEHAHDEPEVVVDLTYVAYVADAAAELLVRLGALTHGAGGRLLVVCPTANGDAFMLHELRPDEPLDAGRVDGALGRALRHLGGTARAVVTTAKGAK